MLSIALALSFTLQVFEPSVNDRIVSIVKTEQVFSQFISDFERDTKKQKSNLPMRSAVLESMKLLYSDYRLARLNPKRTSHSFACVDQVERATIVQSLISPVDATLRLSYFSNTSQKALVARQKKSKSEFQKYKRQFYMCMESRFKETSRSTSAELDSKELLKHHFEKLIAD